MRHRLLTVLPFVALVAASCTTDNPGYVDSYGTCESGTRSVREQFALPTPDLVDVLFVVENTTGMGVYQTRLAEAMPVFVEALDAQGIDWRAGVITTDMADGAALQVADSCGVAATAMVEAGDANAATVLGCNVMVGEGGSPFAQGLNAAAHAFGEGGTASFLRDGARLLVVTLAAHDDCSLSNSFDTSSPNNCVWQADGLQSIDDLVGTVASFPMVGDARLRGNAVSLVTFSAPSDGNTYTSPNVPAEACNTGAPAYSGHRYRAATDLPGVVGLDYNICDRSYQAALLQVVDEAIQVDENTVCMSVPMVGDPNAVRMIDVLGLGGSELFVLEGGDYLTLGETETCANGALAISTEAHAHLATHNVEVFFCHAE